MTVSRETLKRTALYEEHIALGARMVPFAGWEMPVQYAGIVEEHNAVRLRAGIFDVSHMGRFEAQGTDAARFLRYLCTSDITALLPGEGRYCVMCREDGGILDDVYVFALTAERYLLVVNAANAEKIRAWMRKHLGPFDVALVDRQASTAMIAVQGPEAVGILSRLLGADFVGGLRPRRCGVTQWQGRELFASRTGYTGEDGLELVIEAELGAALWKAVLLADVQPCGLGARDTLRLEAALLLYGNDIDEETNPWEVGLGWVVSLDDGADFVGRAALLRLKDAGVARRLVCLRARDRGIMRAGCRILRSGREVGKVTSGGYSPTLGVSIGMGFVSPELADPGTTLTVDVRGRHLAADVVPRPFYKRPRS